MEEDCDCLSYGIAKAKGSPANPLVSYVGEGWLGYENLDVQDLTPDMDRIEKAVGPNPSVGSGSNTRPTEDRRANMARVSIRSC